MFHEAVSRAAVRPGLAYALAVALPAAAAWAELLLSRPDAPFLFVASGIGIAVAAWYGGFWPGMVSVIVSALAIDYVVAGPRVLLQVGSAAEAWALAFHVSGWVLVCALLHRDSVNRSKDRAARAAAESAAAHAERSAQLTAALGRARSVQAVIEATVQEPLHLLTGDAAMVMLVSEEGAPASVARAIGYEDGPQPELASLSAPGPVRDAARRRAPVAVESREAWTAEYGSDSQDPSDAYAAVAAVPLVVGHRLAAIARIDFRDPRTFSDNDLMFLSLLSAQASQALERATEQESDQRARVEAEGLRARADEELARRQSIEHALRASETRYRALATRTTRLHALTAALSESVTTEAVARAIVQQATVVVGATAGEVLMPADDRRPPEASDTAGAGGVRRFTPEPGLCETDVLATRQPVFIRSWEESQETYWRSASAAADAAYSSSAALPLLVDGAPALVLRFDFSVPVNFDEEYQALLVSVAQHSSQALDRARLYETAQRARAEAEAASRLKDDFLSIVSHELRTPLNAVLGWASMLRKSAPDSPLAQRAIGSIHENATRQAQLIDDLLDLSRISAGRATLDCQEIDVSALVGGVVESLTPAAVSSDVTIRLAPAVPAFTSGDRRRLEQVFFNILGNALKFTPSGGGIDIKVQASGSTAEVRIRDTGVGIAPEFLPFVFDRFRQADSTSTRPYGGLGLGLSIAKQLVEAHKGTILVESDGRNRGTTFVVRLPLTASSQPRDVRANLAPRREAAEPPRLNGTRVLVVDDERDAREVMSYALSQHGAVVATAAAAPEAYDLLMSGGFDVLLADIAMPGEDGCSLIRRVRACPNTRVAQIPAAAVTAHARDDERRGVLDAGFHVHLVKPIEPADLVRAVGELHGGAAVTTA